MAKLIDLVDGYNEALVKIKVAIAEAEDMLMIAPEAEKDTLRVQLGMLRTIKRELREVRHVCLNYYTGNRNPRYCYVKGGN